MVRVLLNHALLNSNFIGCTEEEKSNTIVHYIHMYAKVHSVSERENENDLSLFLISESPWYHSRKKKERKKKREKLEVRV